MNFRSYFFFTYYNWYVGLQEKTHFCKHTVYLADTGTRRAMAQKQKRTGKKA